MGLIGEVVPGLPLRLHAGRFCSAAAIAAYVERIDFERELRRAQAGETGPIRLATGHPVARRICSRLGYAMQEGAAHPRVIVGLG